MKKSGFKLIYLLLPLFLTFTVSTISCRKDNDDDLQKPENTEFFKIMSNWYYWYDVMPNVNPGIYASPYELLEALRFRPDDKWSYISSKEELEAYYQDSKYIGYGFGSAFDQEGKLRVTFIFNTVQLYANGVRRSWIIDKINQVKVQSGTNINQALGPNEVGVTNTFLFLDPDDPDGPGIELTLPKQEVIMNTVLHKEVIEAAGKRVGYLVFKNFTAPSFAELEAAVDFFNSEGIDELILDLRYNGGGQTNVANYLGSIIGGSKVANKPFAKYLYNNKRESAENFTDNFAAEQKTLDLDRLIAITTRSTASASEMVINGLKPFMPVYMVGEDTYGKPMGMNVWYYMDYAFVPVTFKIANANDEGDYFDGLRADSDAPDDITRMFGDPDEASLKAALGFIETGSFKLQPRLKMQFVQPYEQMSGLRREIGAH